MKDDVRTPKEIFDQAYEIASPVERQAYLDQACTDAPGLRQKVEALLQAFDDAGSFLQKPAFEASSMAPFDPNSTIIEQASDREPETTDDQGSGIRNQETGNPNPDSRFTIPASCSIGPYRLIRKLGEGGMGTVYLAEQDRPIRRQVALKIIKPGMDSAPVIARFEAERQALTMMDHSSIARVYDAGTTASEPGGVSPGRPYFVMELVKGVPLTRFCDENKLTLRDRLSLFEQVCQAIHHAHQKGIIHRDIKPSNVLVTTQDGKPVPKVIDFGLAKAIEQSLTEQPLLTQFGAVLGTPVYISPEQADVGGAGVDTRTDVFSLGVLLYELLTGTTPLDGSKLRVVGIADFLRMLKEEEPPKPSVRVAEMGDKATTIAALRRTDRAKLAKLLRGELDWIVLKALEKDRNRRYETAVDFAKDVQRYLTDEPVAACPPSTGYRVRKFARKHRTLLASVTAFVGLLVGLVVVLVVSNQRLGRANEQLHLALDMGDGVVQALTQNGSKIRDKQKSILRNLLNKYSQFLSDPGKAEDARAMRAATQLRMAFMSVLIEDFDHAESGYRGAIDSYEGLAGDFPRIPIYRSQLAKSHFNLGILLRELNRRPEAEAAFRHAINSHEKLAQELPEVPLHRGDLADDWNNLGAVLSEQTKLPDAEKAYRQAIASGEELVGQYPDFSNYQINLAASCSNLGNVVRDQNHPSEALIWYGKAIASLDAIVAQKQSSDDARFALRCASWDRANALGQLERHVEAVADWKRAISLDDGTGLRNLQLFLDAAEMAEKLQVQAPQPGGAVSAVLLYGAARANAKAIAAAEATSEPSLARYYTIRALSLLQHAKATGFFRDAQSVERLKNDPDFAHLRENPSFQALLKAPASETISK